MLRIGGFRCYSQGASDVTRKGLPSDAAFTALSLPSAPSRAFGAYGLGLRVRVWGLELEV